MAKYNLDKVKLRANVVSGLLLKRALLWGDRRGLLVILWLTLHLTLFLDLLRKRIFADSGSQPVPPLLCRWIFPLNSFSVTVPIGGCMQGWFPFASLPRIPPCYAWCVQAPVQLLKHQFSNSSIGDEFNYLNDKNREEWKEGLRNCLNSISLTFTSRKKYSSWSTMSANEGLIKGSSFQQDLISVYLQIRCSIHYFFPLIYSFNSNNLNTAKLQSIEQRHVN